MLSVMEETVREFGQKADYQQKQSISLRRNNHQWVIARLNGVADYETSRYYCTWTIYTNGKAAPRGVSDLIVPCDGTDISWRFEFTSKPVV